MSELNKKSGDFSIEERSKLLEQYERSGLEYPEFAKEHNINPSTLRNWIFLKKNNGKAPRFSPVEKKKIVEAFLASGMTREQFGVAWGVSGSSVGSWVSRYQEEGSEGLMNRSDGYRRGMRTSKVVQDEIVAIKKQDPSFGLKKIKNWMYRSCILR